MVVHAGEMPNCWATGLKVQSVRRKTYSKRNLLLPFNVELITEDPLKWINKFWLDLPRWVWIIECLSLHGSVCLSACPEVVVAPSDMINRAHASLLERNDADAKPGRQIREFFPFSLSPTDWMTEQLNSLINFTVCLYNRYLLHPFCELSGPPAAKMKSGVRTLWCPFKIDLS